MRNIRVFMEDLEKNGDLARVSESLDSELEVSAVTAKNNRNAGPALHFQNVKDYPGYSLASGLFVGPGNLFLEKRKYWQRVCQAMGLSKDTGYQKFIDTSIERMTHQILPLEISMGPVKDVINKGEDVDIEKLPIPHIHRGDGGQYGTLQTMIVKDIDSDWTVWQNARTMVIGKDRLVGHIPARSNLDTIWQKYKLAQRNMPFCLCIAPPPLVTITSFLNLSRGESPAGIAGGLNLDPIELIDAETNDLMIPAQAEIVIEGEVLWDETAEEGPFPEYWFYTEKEFKPVFKIKAITHRNEPIIPFSVDGVKPSDTHMLESLMLSIEIFKRCTQIRNLPIKWVQVPEEFNLNVVVVCSPILFSGYVSWVSRYVLSQSRKLGALYNKVIVVDEKTPDIALDEIVNDVILRIHPNRGYHFVEDGMTIGPNARFADKEQKQTGTSSGIYLDTSWPKEWSKDDIPRKVGLEGSFPKELLDKVANLYNQYGYKGKPVIFEESIIPF